MHNQPLWPAPAALFLCLPLSGCCSLYPDRCQSDDEQDETAEPIEIVAKTTEEMKQEVVFPGRWLVYNASQSAGQNPATGGFETNAEARQAAYCPPILNADGDPFLSGRLLFGEPEPGEAHIEPETIPRELRRYCVYEEETELAEEDVLAFFSGDDFDGQPMIADRDLRLVFPEQEPPATSDQDPQVLPDQPQIASQQPYDAWDFEDDGVAAYLRSGVSQHIGAVERTGGTHFDSPLVRLTFMDNYPTAPFDQQAPLAESVHGYTLAAQAHAALCGDAQGDCPVDVRTRLSMEWTWTDAPTLAELDPLQRERGAALGSLSWLAQSIFRETRDWQSDPSEQHLIMNFSLGWNPIHTPSHQDNCLPEGIEWPSQGSQQGSQKTFSEDLNCEPYDELPVSARAVYAAMAHAHCSGALLVAAAGNQSNGPEGWSGPVFPALWMTETGGLWDDGHANDAGFELSDEARLICSDFVEIEDFDAASAVNARVDAGERATRVGAPPIYAVGAVDRNDADLSVARPHSKSPLVAYGDHVLLPLNHAPKYPSRAAAPLTGTSVSASVVSTAAAISWVELLHASTDTTNHEVMQCLYEAGGALGGSQTKTLAAEFPTTVGTNQWNSGVRKISRTTGLDALTLTAGDESSCVGLATQPGVYQQVSASSSAAPPSWSYPTLSSVAGYRYAECGEQRNKTQGQPDTKTEQFRCLHTDPLKIDDQTERPGISDCDRKEYKPYLCPSLEIPSISLAPTTLPQPTSTSCPPCTLDLTPAGIDVIKVKGGIWASPQRPDITAMTLNVRRGENAGDPIDHITLDLSDFPSLPNDPADVPTDVPNPNNDVTSATITTVVDGVTWTTPLILIQ